MDITDCPAVACSTTATEGGYITCHRQISPELRKDFTHATGVDITDCAAVD